MFCPILQAHALQALQLALEDKFELVTGIEFTEIDADHYVLCLEGFAKGDVALNRGFWDVAGKVFKTGATLFSIWG